MELNLQVGPYIWLTYQEVYDKSIQIGSSIRERGVNPVRAILGFPLCLLWNVGIWPLILFILIGDEFSFGLDPLGVYVMEIVRCGRVVDAAYMDPIAQSGLLQWRYALGVC